MKILISLIIILTFFSCKKDEEYKTQNYISYYANGNIKEIGLTKNRNRIGWWTLRNSDGKLLSKSEFIIKENNSFLNQVINYDEKGNIDYKSSSFFRIQIPDTIKIGKNGGKLKYFTSPKPGYVTRFVYIIIENSYANKTIRKNTFTDNIDKLWFGINTLKPGKFKLKGEIEEEICYVTKNKDSSSLNIKKAYKYFQKDLWVK